MRNQRGGEVQSRLLYPPHVAYLPYMTVHYELIAASVQAYQREKATYPKKNDLYLFGSPVQIISITRNIP